MERLSKQEIHLNVNVAINTLSEVRNILEASISGCPDDTYLHDLMMVAVRNVYIAQTKLAVASDITQTRI